MHIFSKNYYKFRVNVMNVLIIILLSSCTAFWE